MIDYRSGFLEIECDVCGEQQEYEADTFVEGLQESKQEGWIHKKIDDDTWLHFCSDECEKKYADDTAQDMFQLGEN